MRISDWSSDVCSSDLVPAGVVAAGAFAQVGGLGEVLRTGVQCIAVVVADEAHHVGTVVVEVLAAQEGRRGLVHAAVVGAAVAEIGRASCRERVCQYV